MSLALVPPIAITVLFYRAHNEFIAGIRETQQNRPTVALVHYRAAQREAMALDPMDASHPIELAMMLKASRKAEGLAEAETVLIRAILLDPINRPEAYRALADVYQRQGRPDAAAGTYRHATGRYLGLGFSGTMPHLLLWPEVVRLVLDAAEFFATEGNVVEARRVLRAALAEDPHHPELRSALQALR